MIQARSSFVASRQPHRPLRLGYVPLLDCAPLLLARELGYYRKYGLDVSLSRELGWATIRDKVVFGELDAAHAVAGLPFTASLGVGCPSEPCLTGLVLSLQGNAIILSQELVGQGVRTAADLKREVMRRGPDHLLTLGIVSRYSAHHFLLRQWLRSAGLEPGRDVRLAVVPPVQVAPNLKAGNLDGFCVGEPWNVVACSPGGGGVCVATSAQLAPGHPEKVLMVREQFAWAHESEHLALIAALLEAGAFCAQPENRDYLAQVLCRREHLNLPADQIRNGLESNNQSGSPLFSGPGVNEPTTEKAAWVWDGLREMPQLLPDSLPRRTEVLARFDQEVFHQALQLVPTGLHRHREGICAP